MHAPASPTRRLIENLVSNYGYVAFLALIPVFVVPLYLRLLGAAAWGSVAVCLTLQGLLFSLDMALGPLMLRDVARAAAAHAPWMYRRFLKIYAGTAIVICMLGLLLLALLDAYRLRRAEPISPDMLCALRLAFVQFLFQFSNNAAIGYWNGLERQRLASVRLVAFTLTKHALALTLLVAWRASACAYMASFALVAAIEFALNHRSVRNEKTHASIDAPPPPLYRNDALGFALAALLGLATAQIDRGYLSLALPASDYGLYFLISVPMLTLFSLQMPIQRAYLPRLATASSPQRVAVSMLIVTSLLIVIPALVLAAFAQPALSLWLHDAELAAKGAAAFRLLMLTVAMSAIAGPAGLLLLNRHRNATIAALNASILIVQASLLIWLTPRLGMLAGAIAWLACGLIQLLLAPAIWRAFGRGNVDAGSIGV
jgi:O-antigen/teichoic acid export membrane protein